MSGLIQRKIPTVASALAKLPAARPGRYKTQFHGNGRFPYKRPDNVCRTYIKLPIVRIQTAIKSSGAWGFKTANSAEMSTQANTIRCWTSRKYRALGQTHCFQESTLVAKSVLENPGLT